jgi:Protein kinase domain.
VFSVIDATGSGCISFGVEKDNKKYFFKIAGVKTVESEVSEEESIRLLKEAIIRYQNIQHDNLIKYIESFDYNEFFVVIYEYAEGECLFDHWNFERYKETKELTPLMRFKSLPIEKRLNVVYKLFSFFETTIEKGYIAVDFYDSSIIYNFETDNVTFCDIDLFRKMPATNDLGEDYFGTKRLKAPEENELNAIIDEQTSEFTLGAIIFDMFSNITNLEKRYKLGMFIPNNISEFELSKDIHDILLKATDYNRENRFKNIKEFEFEFKNKINGQ